MSIELSSDDLYAGLDQETRLLVQQRATAIRETMRRVASDLVTIGQWLIEVRDRLGHGRFLTWLQAEFRWTDRHARRLMAVARVFGGQTHLDRFAPSALYLLAAASTPAAARAAALAAAAAGAAIDAPAARRIIAAHRTDAAACPMDAAADAREDGPPDTLLPDLDLPEGWAWRIDTLVTRAQWQACSPAQDGTSPVVTAVWPTRREALAAIWMAVGGRRRGAPPASDTESDAGDPDPQEYAAAQAAARERGWFLGRSGSGAERYVIAPLDPYHHRSAVRRAATWAEALAILADLPDARASATVAASQATEPRIPDTEIIAAIRRCLLRLDPAAADPLLYGIHDPDLRRRWQHTIDRVRQIAAIVAEAAWGDAHALARSIEDQELRRALLDRYPAMPTIVLDPGGVKDEALIRRIEAIRARVEEEGDDLSPADAALLSVVARDADRRGLTSLGTATDTLLRLLPPLPEGWAWHTRWDGQWQASQVGGVAMTACCADATQAADDAHRIASGADLRHEVTSTVVQVESFGGSLSVNGHGCVLDMPGEGAHAGEALPPALGGRRVARGALADPPAMGTPGPEPGPALMLAEPLILDLVRRLTETQLRVLAVLLDLDLAADAAADDALWNHLVARARVRAGALARVLQEEP